MTLDDPRLELKFLGSLAYLADYDMKEARAYVETAGIVYSDFTKPDHWTCYEAIVRCINLNVNPYSAENLVRELAGKVVNPGSVVAQALDAGDTCYDGYGTKLKELADKRTTVNMLNGALLDIKNGDDLVSIRTKVSSRLLHTRGSKRASSLSDYLDKAVASVESSRSGAVEQFVRTGIRDLDNVIGGWQKTLNLVGAEPGVGKTAVFATSIHWLANSGYKTALISLEDEPTFLAWRLLSAESNVSQSEMRFKRVADKAYEAILNGRHNLEDKSKNVFVVDGSDGGMRIEDIVGTCNDLIVNHGVQVVFVDHLGEILSSQSERYDLEVTRHLSLLRGVANRHGVPMVVASHLKRKADQSLPPTLSDFANSSGAERRARVALGLHRLPGSDNITIHVLKQTNGPSGQAIPLRFHGAAAMIYQEEGGIR